MMRLVSIILLSVLYLFSCSIQTEQSKESIKKTCEYVKSNKLRDNGKSKVSKVVIKKVPNLVNQAWQCNISRGCVNAYNFNEDSTYSYWSCEHEIEYTGDFSIQKDTLDIYQTHMVGNVEVEEKKVKLSMIFMEDYFIMVKREELIEDNWVNIKIRDLSKFKYYKVPR